MAGEVELSKDLWPRLEALRKSLSSKGWRSPEEDALLEELDALARATWIVPPETTIRGPGHRDPAVVELRVSSGGEAPVGVVRPKDEP